jgi:AraC family transcriptional regulator of adaptative response/methylated-DNA-[protein]-cysteine methyltransferase
MKNDTEPIMLDPNECWRAVQERDSNTEGRFVYAVKSTGIYCRPTCPSRRPRRVNTLFFSTPKAAEREGFRPCRRCQPHETAAITLRIKQVCRYLEEHQDSSTDLGTLAALVHLSPSHLQRTFKQVMGISPREYADALRLQQFKTHLREGQPVTDAMTEAGYNSASRLYERTPSHMGMTPTSYRKGGKDMKIGYTTGDCSLGRLGLAATTKGICFLELGKSDAELLTHLENEFPAAELYQNDPDLQPWITAALRLLEGETTAADLPLDVQATAFQRRVWTLLQQIPYGSTRTYGEIARELGQPRAARAVGRACATNPISLLVPCHRVVREDGQLGGYRWGIERKEALLKRERER